MFVCLCVCVFRMSFYRNGEEGKNGMEDWLLFGLFGELQYSF